MDRLILFHSVRWVWTHSNGDNGSWTG